MRSYRLVLFLVASISVLSGAVAVASAKQDANKPDEARLKPAYRFQRDGWVYIHLEGSPADIGYQHGYLLAPEIEDGFKTVQTERRTSHQARLEFLPSDGAEHSVAAH